MIAAVVIGCAAALSVTGPLVAEILRDYWRRADDQFWRNR